MRSRHWRLRLEDVLEAITRIERYTTGMDLQALEADDKTVDAVVRNLEIIGEAARHVPQEAREEHAHVPWDTMQGMRNVLIHEYFGVSLPIIWHTIKHDLPPLVPLLREILDEDDVPEQ